MKKFTNGDDVVLTMTGRECLDLTMLVTSGVIRRIEEDFWDGEQIEQWKKLRDQLNNYE